MNPIFPEYRGAEHERWGRGRVDTCIRGGKVGLDAARHSGFKLTRYHTAKVTMVRTSHLRPSRVLNS
jgi:hypothetical protein